MTLTASSADRSLTPDTLADLERQAAWEREMWQALGAACQALKAAYPDWYSVDVPEFAAWQQANANWQQARDGLESRAVEHLPDLVAAARERDRLAAENTALRGALKPFADQIRNLQPWQGADGHDGAIDDCPLWKFQRCWSGDAGPTVGDCRRAATLLLPGAPDGR